MNIEKLHGTEARLYELVAPLVMSIPILRQNNNYPFKTSENHTWFVALEDDEVVGFMPVEDKGTSICIDNYYTRGENNELLSQLIAQVVKEFKDAKKTLYAVAHMPHAELFRKQKFVTKIEWKLYVKMTYQPNAKSKKRV